MRHGTPPVPELTVPTVGASGCILALAGAYAVMFVRHRIGMRLMVVVFPIHTFYVQAIWVLLLWFGMDVFLTLPSLPKKKQRGLGPAASRIVAVMLTAWSEQPEY